MRPQFRSVDGISIRFAENDGPRVRTVLLLNPWPESLYAFESIWPQLSRHSRLVAVDMPGFGHSERRDEPLSPRTMGEFVARLIEEWELGTPHILGPDVGTGAALFAAALHPGKVSSLIVGSGGTAFPLQVTGALKDIIDAPDVEMFRAMDARALVAGALQGIEKHKLSDAAREDYLRSYEGDRFAESMSYVRSYPRDLPILGKFLPEIKAPVQIIAGRRDALVPPVNAEYLHERLAHSKLDILDTGHFVWEDGADEYETIVSAWLQGGHENV
jgi:pimeloyl-ACP methyl ester carboxylesterase